MIYFESLIRALGPPPESPLGPKPQDGTELDARLREAQRLTGLLEAVPAFSFVRLGDMDLGLLLAAQDGVCEPEKTFGRTDTTTGTSAQGCLGIGSAHARRLRQALESADYVDFHQRLWPVGLLLPQLKLARPAHLHGNSSAQTSYLLLTWLEREFKGYCERHRTGFCGAEAEVLNYLHDKEAFHEAATGVWPRSGHQFFHQPRDNGSNLDANLDVIKADLVQFIRETGIDTLFLSLGGAAKILCHELAAEEGIRCIDFGAMLRALCYLGSDGNRAARSTHSPFYHRLPFDLVMDAVEAAYPALPPEDLLAKAHAQLILELQKKEIGWTSASQEYDFGPENRRIFQQGHRAYVRRYRKLLDRNAATRLERKRFLHFCGKHRLTFEGRIFYSVFVLKSILSQLACNFRNQATS